MRYRGTLRVAAGAHVSRQPIGLSALLLFDHLLPLATFVRRGSEGGGARAELLKQTQSLMPAQTNPMQRQLHMRARPSRPA